MPAHNNAGSVYDIGGILGIGTAGGGR
jgi:hypothetical protein